MARRGGVDPRMGVSGFDVEGDGDDGEPERLELGVQCLPPGQAQSGSLNSSPSARAAPCARAATTAGTGCRRGRSARGRRRRPCSTCVPSWRPDPSAVSPCSSSRTTGMPSRAAAASASTVPSSRRTPGAGTQISPRHRPSGFGSQPASSANRAASTRSTSESAMIISVPFAGGVVACQSRAAAAAESARSWGPEAGYPLASRIAAPHGWSSCDQLIDVVAERVERPAHLLVGARLDLLARAPVRRW